MTLRILVGVIILSGLISAWPVREQQREEGPFGINVALGLVFVERTVDGVVQEDAYVDENIKRPGASLLTLSERRANFSFLAQINSEDSDLLVYSVGIRLLAQ